MWRTRYSCQILMKLEFFNDFRIILEHQLSGKSVQWEPSCSLWTDMKLTVAFRNIAEVPKKEHENESKQELTWTIYNIQAYYGVVLPSTQRAGQSGFGSPVGAWDIYLRRNVETSSGTHFVSHSVGTAVLSWTYNSWALSSPLASF
jgi:hypothetical protein